MEEKGCAGPTTGDRICASPQNCALGVFGVLGVGCGVGESHGSRVMGDWNPMGFSSSFGASSPGVAPGRLRALDGSCSPKVWEGETEAGEQGLDVGTLIQGCSGVIQSSSDGPAPERCWVCLFPAAVTVSGVTPE